MATPQKTANKAAPAKQAGRAAPPPARPAAGKPQQAAQPAKQQEPVRSPQGQAAQAVVNELNRQGREQTTAVAARQTTAVTQAPRQDVPDYIAGSQGRGSENVEMQDMVIPRIELVQALSKCLEEGSGEYIEGAKAGMFYNSVTRDLYGQSVLVCPVFFKKQFLNWRDRQKGGGFGGAYDSMQEAQENIATRDNAQEWEAIETAQQIVLVVHPETYETSEAVLSCARTKVKVSRQWNSLIRVNGFDRFSRLYELFGVDEENTIGQSYKNIGIRYVDWAPVQVYKAAETLYTSIATGARAVKIDDTYIDAGMGAEDAGHAGQGEDPGASEY